MKETTSAEFTAITDRFYATNTHTCCAETAEFNLEKGIQSQCNSPIPVRGLMFSRSCFLSQKHNLLPRLLHGGLSTCSPPLDVVGLRVGGGEEVVGADGARLGPRASPTAQEGTASHGEEAAGPADKHGFTEL